MFPDGLYIFFCQMLFIQGYFNVNLIHFTVKYEIYFLNIFYYYI